MADKDNIPHGATNGPVAWIALVFSIVALIMAGSLYMNLYNVQRQIEQAADATVEVTQDVVAEARQDIIYLSTRIDVDIPEAELVAEIQELRQNIAVAAENASQEVQQELAELDQELEAIETEARQDSAAAVQSFQNLAEQAEQDLRTDEEGQPLN